MIAVDLFSCSGAASRGYERTGFVTFGDDIAPQPNYRGPFRQFDALATLRGFLAGDLINFGGTRIGIEDVDLWHASPPCQGYTTLAAVHGNDWPRLIPDVRKLLIETGKPYVIENVAGARAELIDPIMLCGEMFGLDVIRHRYFESNVPLTVPAHKPHRGRVKGWRHGEFFDGPYFAVYGDGGGKGTVEEWQQAMGIDWTDNRREIAEAIPPAYTEWIGHELMRYLAPAAAA